MTPHALDRYTSGDLSKPDTFQDLIPWITDELYNLLVELEIETEVWAQYLINYLPLLIAAESLQSVIDVVRFLDLPKHVEKRVIEWVYEIFSKT